MNREKILNMIGLSLLLICFIISVQRIFFRKVEQLDPNFVQLRMSHSQLEGSVRDAFDAVMRDY